MPPRLPLPSAELPSLASSGMSPLELALRTFQSCRYFSATSSRKSTIPAVRSKFYQWRKTRGKHLAQHRPGQPNYLDGDGKIPFPSNPFFRAQPVLSEESRDLIHRRVSVDDEPIKVVSADLGVDHRRVAAVVRMKEVEMDWRRMGKKLATPYARAVMGMLPKHHFSKEKDVKPTPLEPINEIHVHGYTMQQLFIPTSESRHFTREDAANAFNPKMLSADSRMPHKELVKHLTRVKDGARESTSHQQFVKEARESERADVLLDASKKEFEKRITQIVPTDRAAFRFKKMTVDDAGPDGRSRRGVGWRYGAPYEDRKKDQVHHPLKYE